MGESRTLYQTSCTVPVYLVHANLRDFVATCRHTCVAASRWVGGSVGGRSCLVQYPHRSDSELSNCTGQRAEIVLPHYLRRLGIEAMVQPTAKQRTSTMRSQSTHELVHTAVASTQGKNTTHTTISTSKGRWRIRFQSAPRRPANRSAKNTIHSPTIQRNQSLEPNDEGCDLCTLGAAI
jgi:hypothetical protein